MGAAGIIETFGGALMLLGLFTRPVAFVLSGQMAVAYFIRHAPRGTWPILNGGELAVLFCFLWLFFVAAGPGPWSIDGLRNGVRRTNAQHEATKNSRSVARENNLYLLRVPSWTLRVFVVCTFRAACR